MVTEWHAERLTTTRSQKANMADSVRLEQTPKRPVGGGLNTGRIHKGHGKTAASSSIPSKYQTIVTDNSEKKGFLSRSRRFNEDSLTYNPGPGRYDQLTKTESEATSFSKRGTGCFASKTKRFARRRIQGESGPGPGTYAISGFRENNFNRSGATSVFHLPIAVKRNEDKKNSLPAPNHYKIGQQTGRVTHDNNVSASAAFKSGSTRSVNPKSTSGPSPFSYKINEKLVSDAPKTVTAPFKSTVERKMMQSPVAFPGPGAYQPFDHDQHRQSNKPKRGFLNKHYLCISAPAIPLPSPDPMPGPGHYNVVDYQGPPKHFMSSSVFVSSTSRWTGDALNTEEEFPGPATYRPQNAAKQSFHYNYNSRWLPA
ncbi:O(6)-methylguanine-induced apoptosis 2-like [Actinia tenebrosa]|uniref:O(6)-methylguanine-induced apoptosis 2-like n=1 Tax=Actinia tenebrosa TaxID=6105 RepID=A0A6P8I3Y6_ACTTE|nr:O(6)-methylguanine-induced apoptosis 2-like [Actinia tenebrosa]